MQWCEKCRGYHQDRELCFRSWKVWSPDQFGETIENASIVLARDAEHAAERWASELDSEYEESLWGKGIDVLVIEVERPESTAVRVNVTAEVSYFAEKIEELPAGET